MFTLRAWARNNQLARRLYAETFTFRALRTRFQTQRSFAQDGEDTLIEELLGRVAHFVDIGAHDGISGSNTFYFAQRGASGWCFEPVADTFCRLRATYRLNHRVHCIKIGISDRAGKAEIQAADFLSFIAGTEDAEHTAVVRDAFLAAPKPETITITTFAEAAERYGIPSAADLLSVDVEGHELNVLRSVPFDHFSFRAIILETHLRGDDGQLRWRHRDLQEIEQRLEAAGYLPARTTRSNTIYLRNS